MVVRRGLVGDLWPLLVMATATARTWATAIRATRLSQALDTTRGLEPSAILATPALQVGGEMLEMELAGDFPTRREARGVGLEREGLVVDTTDGVGEVGTGDSGGEAVAGVEEREASKAGVKEEEEPGEEGDEVVGVEEVAGSRGSPSSSTAW